MPAVKRVDQEVLFVPDDTNVVRYSELKKIYEREGSLRATASVFGSNESTVVRHLRLAGVDTSASPGHLRRRISELEAELAAERNGRNV